MKKILFVLTVLLLATPAMAVVNVNAVQSGTDPCQVYITYSNDEDSNVRAFALDLWVDDGNILAIEDYNVGECIGDANCGYGIFMGTIQIDSGGNVTNDGTPVAEEADLPSDTLPGPDSNGVTTEMGSLYELGVVPGPKQTGTLCKLILSKVPCNLTIKTNVSRAGIVLENGESSEDAGPPFTTNLPQVVPLTGAEACICAGDLDANSIVDVQYDLNTIIGALTWEFIFYGDWIIEANSPNMAGIECADTDANGVVDVQYDLNTIIGNLTWEYIFYNEWWYDCGDYNP